jgi:hypothetical protein
MAVTFVEVSAYRVFVYGGSTGNGGAVAVISVAIPRGEFTNGEERPVPTAYSGTPLAKKLGITEGCDVHAIDAPPGYHHLLAPLPAGVTFAPRLTEATDVVHVFVTSTAKLRKALPRLRRAIRPSAAIWVSWPKKAAKVQTDLTEDVVREIALPLGLVDVKVCAVDQIWSGLKLVVRKELR